MISGLDHINKVVESDEAFNEIPIDKDIKAVLVGEDITFNFYKMGFASICME